MFVTGLAQADITRMRDQLFFESPERSRRLSRISGFPLSRRRRHHRRTPVAVIVPLTVSSDRIDKTTIRQSDVQAVADHWVSAAGWSVLGVTVTDDQVLVEAIGTSPAPGLAGLRQDLDAAGLNGLDVRVSLVTASYKPLPG